MKRKMINVNEDTYNDIARIKGTMSFESFFREVVNRNDNDINQKNITDKISLEDILIDGEEVIPESTRYEVIAKSIYEVLYKGEAKITDLQEAEYILSDMGMFLPRNINILFQHAIRYHFANLVLPSYKTRVESVNQKTYLMYSNDTCLYKIGKSENVENRLNTIVRFGVNAEVVHIIDKNIETELHRKFKEKRKKGEWFDLSKEDTRYIKSILS